MCSFSTLLVELLLYTIVCPGDKHHVLLLHVQGWIQDCSIGGRGLVMNINDMNIFGGGRMGWLSTRTR